MPMRRKGNAFGEWLDVTMSNKRIMGRTLAEAAGVHDSAVSRWRVGKGVPTMESLEGIATLLEVDTLRLAVTAGLVSEKVAGVEPLPTPEPTERRESVKRQLARLRGVTELERKMLLSAYEEATAQEGVGE